MSKVLIIDDDEMLLSVMRRVLQKEGYEVLSTADGPQGITIFKEQRPDIVLLDFRLPSMSGLEVLRELRAEDEHAKVIVVTGHESDETTEVAMRAGAVSYIRKPFDFKSFLIQIKSFVQSQAPGV